MTKTSPSDLGIKMLFYSEALKDVDVLHDWSASAKASARQPSPFLDTQAYQIIGVGWLAEP